MWSLFVKPFSFLAASCKAMTFLCFSLPVILIWANFWCFSFCLLILSFIHLVSLCLNHFYFCLLFMSYWRSSVWFLSCLRVLSKVNCMPLLTSKTFFVIQIAYRNSGHYSSKTLPQKSMINCYLSFALGN